MIKLIGIKLFSSLLSKKYLGIFLGSVLMGFLIFSHTFVYYKGKESINEKNQQLIEAELVRQRAEIDRIHTEEIRILMESKNDQVKIVERIQKVNIFVDTPCNDLGSDWLREFNEAIESVIQ